MFFAPKDTGHGAVCESGSRMWNQALFIVSPRSERHGAAEGGDAKRAGALAPISLPRRVVSAAGEDRRVYRQVGSVSSYVEGNLDLVRCGQAGSRMRT